MADPWSFSAASAGAAGARAGEPRASARPRALTKLPSAELAFAALLALGAWFVVFETRGFSFYADEWDFVVQRRGLSAATLLRPHGPHLVLLPILIFKVLLAVFGGGSYLPFRLLAALGLVLIGLALGVACRDRWGPWWGLAPVLVLVTCGPAAGSTLWPFQIGYALAVAAGIAALIALDRGGRWGDAACCAGLLVSLASGSQGIGFVIGAAVIIALQRGPWRRGWCVAVPVILYVAWYAGYGHQASETSLGYWGGSLAYTFQGLSATLQAAVGLSSYSATTAALDTTYGAPLAILCIAGLFVALGRGHRARPMFWGVLVTLLVLWFAASLSDFGPFGRPATEPRYLVSNLTLVLLCLCAIVPLPRLAKGGTIAACALLGVIALTNARDYRTTRDVNLTADRQTQAVLGGLEVAGDAAAPGYSPDVIDGLVTGVSAAGFADAVRSFHLHEDSPPQILSSSVSNRELVDAELRGAEVTFTLTPTHPVAHGSPLALLSGGRASAGACLTIGSSPVYVRAPFGRLSIRAPRHGSSTIATGRFAPSFTAIGTASDGQTGIARFPADRAPQVPWRLELSGPGGRVCSLGSS